MIATLLLSLAQGSPPGQPSASGNAPHSHVHARGEINETQPPMLIEMGYVADLLTNAAGGAGRGSRYVDNLDMVAEVDLDAIAGWDGAMLHLYGLYNNGAQFSSLVGDAQGVSNIETGARALRLYEAWLEQKIGESASLKFGLYDLNSEFDSLDSAGLFTASAHGIGTEIAQSGENGPSIFPVAALAVRGAVTIAPGWHLRASVLDGVPGDPARPRRTTVKLNDGALVIAEVEAPLREGGKLLFGHWRYTDAQDRVDGTRGHGAAGTYLRGETTLFREQGSSKQGLDAFARWGVAHGDFYAFGHFASAGLNWTGPIKGRDTDQLGIAVASAFTSRAERRARIADRAETAIELTYRAPLTDWLTIQPSAHYVINPNADPALSNALVFGLRTSFHMRLTN